MASVNLSPLFNGITNFDQFGQILTGGQIYTYQAGTSTPLATYTDSDGNIFNTNPIILGSDGKLPQELWLQAGYNYKFVLTTYLGVTVNTYDNIGGLLTQLPPNPISIPTGCILIWSGSAGSIPSGYVLCDGTTPGVPDLRDSFIIGAGNNYPVGQTGGSKDSIVVSHTHTATVTDPGHNHQSTNGNLAFINISGGGSYGFQNGNQLGTITNTTTATTGISVTNQSTGQSGTNANLPPYYALCYIYKT